MSNISLEKAGTLTPIKRKAALLLADGLKITVVAKKLDVSVESIRLWKKEDAFAAYLNALLVKIEEDAISLLRSRNLKAAETLTELMAADQPAQVRLKAVMEVLNFNRLQEHAIGVSRETGNDSVASKINKHHAMVQITEALFTFIKTKSQATQAADENVIDVSPNDGEEQDGNP